MDLPGGDTIYETIFRWGNEWFSVLIKPYYPDGKIIHYVVKIVDGPLMFLNKNAEGNWIESDLGNTNRAEVLGTAIEYAQMESGMQKN